MIMVPVNRAQQAGPGAMKLLFSSGCMGISAAVLDTVDQLQRGRIALPKTTNRLVSRLYEVILQLQIPPQNGAE